MPEFWGHHTKFQQHNEPDESVIFTFGIDKGEKRHLMGLLFEWDPNKARLNVKRHGISFDEASTAFRDPLSHMIGDPPHSENEKRFVLIGRSIKGRLLVIVHTERGDRICIVSARLATSKERSRYEENEE